MEENFVLVSGYKGGGNGMPYLGNGMRLAHMVRRRAFPGRVWYGRAG